MAASKRQRERQRANRRAKAQMIEEYGLAKDTKFVEFRNSRKNMYDLKDLTPFYAIKYLDSKVPEADRVYL